MLEGKSNQILNKNYSARSPTEGNIVYVLRDAR